MNGLRTWSRSPLFAAATVALFVFSGCGGGGTAADVARQTAGTAATGGVENALPAFAVDAEAGIYRSGQPTRADFERLAAAGFKSVLNLRYYHGDAGLLAGLPLTEYRLRLNAGEMTEADLVAALTIVRDAPKPLLIHCLHGADRTGAVVAAYRVVFQDYSSAAAVEEMRRFGTHSFWYKNLPRLILGINRERFTTELAKTAQSVER